MTHTVLPQARRILLPGEFSLAVTVGAGEPRRAILFLHGFGSNRHYFRHAFESDALKGCMCVTVDLPGFGESHAPKGYGFAMEDQARLVLSAMDKLGVGSFDLVAHSMGGLVALEMVAQAPKRVRRVVSLEGNLTGSDCFFTQGIVAYPFAEFRERGRAEFVERLGKMAMKTPLMAEYVESFRASSPEALYESARHTVARSAQGLIERFSSLSGATYVYGEQNRGLYDTEALLLERGVPLCYIPDCGHFMALEQPEATFALVGSLVIPEIR